MNDIHEVIEAFVDGEPVEPPRLMAALSAVEGREHLIDLLALRSLVGGGDAKMTPGVVVRNSKDDSGGRFLPLRRLLATAALVVIGVLAGFVAGQRVAGTRASGPAVTVANAAPQIVPVSAPSPTRVIRLENGVDWNERGGGH